MKKLTLILAAIFLFSNGFAQENDLKNFRFGLKASPSMNWYKPDNEKKFNSLGSQISISAGLQLEFRLNDRFSFLSGLDVWSIDKGNIEYLNDTYYALDGDEEFVEFENWTDLDSTHSAFKLSSRSFTARYVNIPLGLKMKTNEIGAMTYYGQFGFDLSVNTKSRVTDEVYAVNEFDTTGGINAPIATTTSLTNSELDNGKDQNLLRTGFNFGAGGEYNLSGSTSVFFGVTYHQGFMNVTRKDSKFLHDYNASGEIRSVEQIFYNRWVSLDIGVLF